VPPLRPPKISSHANLWLLWWLWDVGNAAALSKRSVISTAPSPSKSVMASRQTVIGVRFANDRCGRRWLGRLKAGDHPLSFELASLALERMRALDDLQFFGTSSLRRG
jgi:hypothetical protein